MSDIGRGVDAFMKIALFVMLIVVGTFLLFLGWFFYELVSGHTTSAMVILYVLTIGCVGMYCKFAK